MQASKQCITAQTKQFWHHNSIPIRLNKYAVIFDRLKKRELPSHKNNDLVQTGVNTIKK